MFYNLELNLNFEKWIVRKIAIKTISQAMEYPSFFAKSQDIQYVQRYFFHLLLSELGSYIHGITSLPLIKQLSLTKVKRPSLKRAS